MRWLVAWSLLVVTAWAQGKPAGASGREWIIASGGPSIRYFEKVKKASHDKYWGNFIDSAVIRFRGIKEQAAAGDVITWLVYRPGYAERGVEENADLLQIIQDKAAQAGVALLWFDNENQFINYLNHGQDRARTPIGHFEYFGHSNKACFLFDYSNVVDGLSVQFLHVKDLKKIDRTAFTRDAYCKSWGCHSGEFYSERWFSNFGVPMEGAIGKTDYSNGGMPVLSSTEGKWFRYTGLGKAPQWNEKPAAGGRN